MWDAKRQCCFWWTSIVRIREVWVRSLVANANRVSIYIQSMRLEALPGQLLDGKYQIDRQLGKGGMGAVFLATHLGTTRTVALKVIVPQLAGQEEFFLRFQREAEAAGRLRHPNVVNVTDFGITVAGGGEIAYLVMEYLDGRTLADFEKETPKPPLPLVLDIIDQIGLALDAAHEAGIIHRDLKPDNIWLESNLRGGYNVKVLDFGIAKVEARAATATSHAPQALRPKFNTIQRDAEESETVARVLGYEEQETVALPAHGADAPTQAMSSTTSRGGGATLRTTVGSVLGTPAYMAPEQCLGGTIDRQADVYSLAVITYQMLTGALPFEASNVTAMLQAQVQQVPDAPSLRRPSIQTAVSSAVLSGLSKNPADRPATAGAFATLLRASAEREAGILRVSKDLVNSNFSPFLSALTVCVAPLLPLVVLLMALAKAAVSSALVTAPVALAAIYVTQICSFLFSLQLFKVAVSLTLQRAVSTGRFDSGFGFLPKTLFAGLGSLALTQLQSLRGWRPSTATLHGLWPVIWAVERRTGMDAVERSITLSRILPATATSLVARFYGPVLVAIFMYPVMIGVLNGGFSELSRFVFNSGVFGYLLVVLPIAMLTIQVGYTPMFYLYYGLLRGCQADAKSPAIPERQMRENPKPPRLGRATVLWAAVPGLMLLAIIASSLIPTKPDKLADAASDGRGRAVRRLLNEGVPVNSSGPSHATALLGAVQRGDADLARDLLASGADPNLATLWWSPLMAACASGDASMAARLLQAGAKVNARNRDLRTPLMFAAIRGDAAVVRLLLDSGADPKLVDSWNRTALDFAREEQRAAVIPLLDRQ